MKVDRTTPPPISDFVRLSIPAMKSEVVADGITLNIIRTGETPANRISLLWNYGASQCQGSFAPSLVPQMMMQATTKLSGAEIVDKIDFLGAFLNHNVGTSYSSFDALSLNQFTGDILEILNDIVCNPIFPEDRFEAIKRKALAQYDLKNSRTRFVASEALTELLAGKNHPYARKLTRRDIEETTIENVRDAWRKGIFKTAINTFASGNITESLKKELINFSTSLRPVPTEINMHVVVPYCPEPPCRIFIESPNARQSSVAVGIPTIPRTNPDYIPLRIAVTALGGYFGSRLMTNIREEKGLTYGINAYLGGTFEGASININADCDKSYVEDVLKEINIEMEKMASAPLPDDEFRRLRSYYMTIIASTLESFKSIGEYYESQITVGIPENYFDEQQSVLESITPEDIRAMAEKYFITSEARTVIVGA